MYEQLFQRIRIDHENARALLRQLREAKSNNERTELLQRVREELIPHMAAEDKAVYFKLEGEDDRQIREDALESREDHHAALLILDALGEISVSDETFPARVKVLRDIAEIHMVYEESQIFQDIRDAFGEEEVLDILDSYLEEHEVARKPPC
jgi:hemerythrin superfamily protein